MNTETDSQNSGVIDRLVDAYNRSDARAFADCFAADASVYEFPDAPAQRNRREIFEFYERLFEEFPENRTEILHRILLGNRVIDHERVRRTAQAEPFEVLTIYELADGEIKRVDFVRE